MVDKSLVQQFKLNQSVRAFLETNRARDLIEKFNLITAITVNRGTKSGGSGRLLKAPIIPFSGGGMAI